MAIDKALYLAFAPSGSREVRFSSLSFPGEVRFLLDNVPDKKAGEWGNYVRGAVRALQQKHQLRYGVIGVASGSLAEGGLSSSAALGVACLMAMEAVNQIDVTHDENILFQMAIENGYLGMKTGILDQSAILHARKGSLTRIDCATRRHEWISPGLSMPPWKILLAFSGMNKALTSTDYNLRVDECASAARTLLSAAGRPRGLPVLRNVTSEEYLEYRNCLKGAPARRAAHFFGEVERVEKGIAAWQLGDLDQFGRLMTASGDSSIHNYECGAPPLTTLYELLHSTPGVYGVRFSGAGFRGCCVALVEPELAEDVAERVMPEYKLRHPEFAERAGVLLCESDDGPRFL